MPDTTANTEPENTEPGGTGSAPERAAPASPPAVDESAARARRRRIWAWLRYVVGVALGAAALYAVSGQRGELVGASKELSNLGAFWVLAAVMSEVASFVAFAKMQQRLLRAADVHLGNGRAITLTVAASAIASSLPAGPAIATVYAYRQYRRAGAEESIAGWGLIATLLCSALGLALVAVAGLVLAEQQGAALDLVGVTIGILVVAVVAIVVFARRSIVGGLTLGALRLVKRIFHVPRKSAEEHLERVARQLSEVRLSWHDLGPSIGWSLGNWCFDCGALALSYMAIGAGIPWKGLLLAYGAGQLASNLPITPGGLGVVEGSLTIALVAFGGAQVSTVAAVILYRIISFWGFLPIGWVVWAGAVIRDRRYDRARARARTGSPPAVAVAVASSEGRTTS